MTIDNEISKYLNQIDDDTEQEKEVHELASNIAVRLLKNKKTREEIDGIVYLFSYGMNSTNITITAINEARFKLTFKEGVDTINITIDPNVSMEYLLTTGIDAYIRKKKDMPIKVVEEE